MLCEYGCGKEAKFQLENGKWCCSESCNSCEAVRCKNSKIKFADKKCPHCGMEFKHINVRTFSNHVRWCDKNPRHEECCGKEFKEKISKKCIESKDKRFGKIKRFLVTCANPKCNKEFFIEEREFLFSIDTRYYCSHDCSYHKEMTEEIKNKIKKSCSAEHIHTCPNCGKEFSKVGTNISKTLCEECSESIDFDNSNNAFLKNHVEKEKTCKQCGKVFKTKRNAQFCSNGCRKTFASPMNKIFSISAIDVANIDEKEIALIRKEIYRLYRVMCSFNFNVFDFPDEFDLSLIEKNGIYSASNHGGNLHGISRDHMYSVNEAFKNNISPLIVSHPANCKLMIHTDNERKHDKSSISLEELKERIRIWDEKYGKYERTNVCSIPSELFDKIKNSTTCHPRNFGYKLIYNVEDLTMKFWDVENNGIPEGRRTECPIEIKRKKLKNFGQQY